MGRNGFMGAFQGLDAFGKTMEDVKIRTRTGALLTFISLAIIAVSTILEFIDYRRVHHEPSIIVDRSRGEKLVVDMDIFFPRVPCYLLSLDIMDISGERQMDLQHDITKTRISKEGSVVAVIKNGQLEGEAQLAVANKDAGYCGSCYGGVPPASGCCNTCEEVRQAYIRKGWSFNNPDGIAQCLDEGWTAKIEEQNSEGCQITGHIKVNKVIGNFHFSPGRAYQTNQVSFQDLVPYLKDKNHHDFGHVINKLQFEGDQATLKGISGKNADDLTKSMKKRLGIVNPLDGAIVHPEESDYMYQYFLKVVSTTYNLLSGETVNSHQYSVTQFERDLTQGNAPGKEGHGHFTSHGMAASPGMYINYEISPMKVILTETRQSFAHFLTSTCAIVGGVLTVAGLIDSFIFNSRKKLTGSNPVEGFGGRQGKMM
ncbi:hypothetical protein NliqN6_4060 [Naganishia liquefaciens]|uniref:Uncharacterized protein n=1 Tax=Naganishia liquefaciens TaxID=104408 RepID=A0A8H3TV53_9TREE|nr:hypothetical protein NliqN6_4060 [Naganishia liquefaciens]